MRLPRDLTGAELAKLLRALGYDLTRQTGSHMRLTTQQNGEITSLCLIIIHFALEHYQLFWATLPSISI
jgi:hypothetical protein